MFFVHSVHARLLAERGGRGRGGRRRRGEVMNVAAQKKGVGVQYSVMARVSGTRQQSFGP